MQLTRADFETILAALEGDAEEDARQVAQDVLQLRAPHSGVYRSPGPAFA